MLNLHLRSLAFLSFSLFPLICSAQADKALLQVNVTDQAGNLVVGGVVKLLPASGREIVLSSDDNGTAVFRSLAAGDYRVVVEVPGFSVHRSDVISLRAGESRKLAVALEIGVIETQVSVDENEALDPNRDGSTMDLKDDQIENLPTDPDELRRVLQAIAGPAADGSQLPVNVDGIPGGQLPPKENIKLVRINRNVFSAEYESPNSGGIFIYTNSNSKRITGYSHFGYGSSRFNASDAFIGRRTPFTLASFFGGVTVPLGKKATLFANANYFRSDTSSIVNAIILTPDFAITEFKSSVDVPSRSGGFDVNLNFDPNQKHKVVINFRTRRGETSNSGTGGLTLKESGVEFSNAEHNFSLSETYIINPEVVNVTRFRSSYTDNQWTGDIDLPSIRVNDAFIGGGSQTDRRTGNFTYDFYNDTTIKVGKFSVGFGAMVRGARIGETSRSNFGGTFTFSGRIAPRLDNDLVPIRDQQGNIITEQISSIESYRRTLLLKQRGFSASQIRALGGGADQLVIAGGDPDISVLQTDYAFYQQNSYGISDTMGFSFGLRYENQTNLNSNFNLAPRLGFIWSPKAGEKQAPIWTLPRITIGLGIFYSRFGINNILSERQTNSTERSFYFITDPAVLDLFPNVPPADVLGGSEGLRSLRLIDLGLQSPRSNTLSFSVTKRLWMDFSLGFNTYHMRGYRRAVVRNINAPIAGSQSYPFGSPRSIHETRSEGRHHQDRYSVYLNFPQLKIAGKPMYATATFAYERSSSDLTTGSGSPLDPYDLGGEWAPTTQDGEFTSWGYFGIPLPYDFFIRGDLSYRTGSRFNIITGRDTNRDGFYSERPAFATDPNKPGLVQTEYGLLDPNPAPGDPIIPRNFARGPRGAGFNLFLSKSFGFKPDKSNKNMPSQRLSLSIGFNNVLNINNKGIPIGNMSSPYFLRSVNRGSEGNYNSSSPRRINFNVGYSF